MGEIDVHGEPVPKDRLATIFHAQRRLQERLGYDVAKFSDEQEAEYVRLNVLSLEDELHEALQETNWKPWSQARPGITDYRAFQGELVDALHFLVNLCLVSGMGADELTHRFIDKNARNHARQDEGYDGSAKCPHCRRALDEPEGP